LIDKRFLSKRHGNIYLGFMILILVFIVLKNTVFFLVLKVVGCIWDATFGRCSGKN
jgi:hypothetical protein